jgi:hypothetical protein
MCHSNVDRRRTTVKSCLLLIAKAPLIYSCTVVSVRLKVLWNLVFMSSSCCCARSSSLKLYPVSLDGAMLVA